MSESRGKVSTLMETNTESQAAAPETTPPTGRFAELQQNVREEVLTLRNQGKEQAQ